MEASVQYNDYKGTTAADRSDLFVELPEQMTQTIFDRFNIPLDGDKYLFIGITVYTTKVEDAYVTLYFKNRDSQKMVKIVRDSVPLQIVLNLFKRFEFQIGCHLEDIDGNQIEEVAKDEE